MALRRKRPAGTVLQTERLFLRRLTLDDAAFVLGLLNDTSFVRYIGDRGVRTVDGAIEYIRHGPMSSYRRLGFGLYLVELKEGGVAIGMCGLVKREALTDVDIGFAYMPAYRGCGYAVEAAAAVLAHAHESVGLRRVVAITSPDNERSAKVLEKIGLRFEQMIKLPEDESPLRLYAWGADGER